MCICLLAKRNIATNVGIRNQTPQVTAEKGWGWNGKKCGNGSETAGILFSEYMCFFFFNSSEFLGTRGIFHKPWKHN